jgi:large subunit ribosomal protein L31
VNCPVQAGNLFSESHAFYTGQQKSVDNLGGRVEKFRNKFAQFRK